MRNTTPAATALFTLLLTTTAIAQVSDDLISRAVLPLPESMRADASVFAYDEDGFRQLLRQGDSSVECKIKDENLHTVCYAKSSATNRDYQAKLQAQGLEGEALQAAMAEALDAGLVEPNIPGSMIYRLDETEGRMKLLWALMLPDTMSTDIAASAAGRFASAVRGMGTPWIMREGTLASHIMIPINGTDLSNSGGADAALDTSDMHPFIQATLPLPADLRRDSTVVTYAPDSGERTNLRQGSNGIVCIQKDAASGFTRCLNETNIHEMDLRMRLSASGESDSDIDAAIEAARVTGDVPPRRFGEFAYRYYEGNEDRLKLLWVIRLPGVTAADTGLPTTAERENLGIGKGTPWLMREGTDGAHLMIPINGTALSNLY